MENRDELKGVVPPNSVEAEVSVLGAMLQDSNAVLHALERLTPDDFYQPEHREIFSAMAELNRNHSPIDLTTLNAELRRRGSLEGIGGSSYLIKLIQQVPTTANVEAYITLTQEKSTLRKLHAVFRCHCEHMPKPAGKK